MNDDSVNPLSSLKDLLSKVSRYEALFELTGVINTASDIESVGEFMRLWMVRNGRLRSPMFIAGESYGTTRAAGLADFLSDRYGIFPSGIVFISSILNWQNQLFAPGNDAHRLWSEGLVSQLLADPRVKGRNAGLLALIETPEAMAAYIQRARSQDDVKRRSQRCIEAAELAARWLNG